MPYGEYAKDYRSGFVPHGVMCVSAGWGTKDPVPPGRLGFTHTPDGYRPWDNSYSWYDPVTGVWEFACSMKNYEDTIRKCVDLVLTPICDAADYCESIYEEFVHDDEADNRTLKYLTTLPRIDDGEAEAGGGA